VRAKAPDWLETTTDLSDAEQKNGHCTITLQRAFVCPVRVTYLDTAGRQAQGTTGSMSISFPSNATNAIDLERRKYRELRSQIAGEVLEDAGVIPYFCTCGDDDAKEVIATATFTQPHCSRDLKVRFRYLPISQVSVDDIVDVKLRRELDANVRTGTVIVRFLSPDGSPLVPKWRWYLVEGRADAVSPVAANVDSEYDVDRMTWTYRDSPADEYYGIRFESIQVERSIENLHEVYVHRRLDAGGVLTLDIPGPKLSTGSVDVKLEDSLGRPITVYNGFVGYRRLASWVPFHFGDSDRKDAVLPEGDAELIVAAEGFDTQRVPIHITADSTTSARVTLVPITMKQQHDDR